jgi:D-arabinose 1-dehydrogenase-like Zn-dependent alcohol dehydrogenase
MARGTLFCLRVVPAGRVHTLQERTDVILATAPNAKAMAEMVGGLRAGGKLLYIGVPAEPMEVSLGPLIMRKRDIQGWPPGTAIDSEDTLRFAELTGVKAMVEKKYPLEKVKQAHKRMLSGKERPSSPSPRFHPDHRLLRREGPYLIATQSPIR